jgi:GTP cyclohydrolase I
MAPTSPNPGPQPDQTPLRMLAEDIEKSLNAIGQTLTDQGTAATYQRTLQICARLLEGFHATGLLDQAQLDELLTAFRGMEQAPRFV